MKFGRCQTKHCHRCLSAKPNSVTSKKTTIINKFNYASGFGMMCLCLFVACVFRNEQMSSEMWRCRDWHIGSSIRYLAQGRISMNIVSSERQRNCFKFSYSSASHWIRKWFSFLWWNTGHSKPSSVYMIWFPVASKGINVWDINCINILVESKDFCLYKCCNNFMVLLQLFIGQQLEWTVQANAGYHGQWHIELWVCTGHQGWHEELNEHYALNMYGGVELFSTQLPLVWTPLI